MRGGWRWGWESGKTLGGAGGKEKKSESPDSAPYEEMLLLLKSFCLQFIHKISEETENWQAKLKKSLELAEEELKKANEEAGENRSTTKETKQ